MKYSFTSKKIEGILSVLPHKEVFFRDEVANYPFPETQSLRLAKIMGYEKKRICEKEDSVSQYAIYGIKKLQDENLLDISEIGAIIVVTTTPDYFTPPVSNIIHGYFDFSKDVVCMDINQACAGYIVGLMQSFLLLDIQSSKKILLITGDLLSKRVSIHDRGSRPLIGDAVTISLITNSDDTLPIYLELKNDGKNAMALNIPAGGFKLLPNMKTSIETKDEYGNYRSLEHLKMDGELVFNFVVHEVPQLVESLLIYSGVKVDDIDCFLFHQPNKFMLQKLAAELDVPSEKMPYNIVELFGNSSSATIPVNISYNLSDRLLTEHFRVCLAGFGAGLTWGGIVMKLGGMSFSSVIDYKG